MEEGLKTYLESFLTPERYSRLKNVLDQRTNHFTVVLEDLYNPQNAHAILRTMDSLGIADLHLIENEHKFNYEAVRRVTKGSEKWVNIYRHQENNSNPVHYLDELKKQGYFICATTLKEKSITCDQIDFTKKTAFVFGNEHEGITDEVVKRADQMVYIPMYGFSESYNISVSVALILNQVIQELKQSEINWELSEQERILLYEQWLKSAVNHSEALIKKYHQEKE